MGPGVQQVHHRRWPQGAGAFARRRPSFISLSEGTAHDHRANQHSGDIARLLLFDEVTSALDPPLVREVLDTMRMLSKEGMTMIVVTHEMRFAREVSDRVAFFREGRIHEIGSPVQIFENAEKPETAAFLKSI